MVSAASRVAEAIAPPDVQADIGLSDGARQRYLKQAENAREAGDTDRARQAEALMDVAVLRERAAAKAFLSEPANVTLGEIIPPPFSASRRRPARK